MKTTALLVVLLLFLALGGQALAQENLLDFSVRYLRSGRYTIPHVKEATDKTPGGAGHLTLAANPDEVVPFGQGFKGMRLFLVNRTEEPVRFMGQDTSLLLLWQEALDEQGKWQPIESGGSGCGYGIRDFRLPPGQYWEFTVPRYSGSFKTKLRFALGTFHPAGKVIYSEAFQGSVNPEQFKDLDRAP